jgi:hypothetical protein
MLALDLFNTPFERALNEGAVDDLEARRIHHLNTRMLELMSRANDADFKASPAGLAGLKREYQKLKDERDSYYKVREAGIPGSVPTEKIPGKEDLLKGRGRTYYEGQESDSDAIKTKELPDYNEWKQKIKAKYPNVRFMQEKMPGGATFADVPGKGIVATYPRQAPFGQVGQKKIGTDSLNEAWDMESWVEAYNTLVANGNKPDNSDPITYIQQLALKIKNSNMFDNKALTFSSIEREVDRIADMYKLPYDQRNALRTAFKNAPTISQIKQYARQSQTGDVQYAQQGQSQAAQFAQQQEMSALQHQLTAQQLVQQAELDTADQKVLLGMDMDARHAIIAMKQEQTLEAKERLHKLQMDIDARAERQDVRDHELAMAQAGYENEIKVIQASAEGEYKKAKLEADYQIKIKELTNIDNAADRQSRLDVLNTQKAKELAVIDAETNSKIKELSAETDAESAKSNIRISELFMKTFAPIWEVSVAAAQTAGQTWQAGVANIKQALAALAKPIMPQATDEESSQKKNSALGEKKLGQLRPKLGSARDIGKSVKKFRTQRGLDEGQVSDEVDHRGDVDTKANIEVQGVDLNDDSFEITYNKKPYTVKIQNFSQEGLGRWQIADYDVDIINANGKNLIDLIDWNNDGNAKTDRQIQMVNTIIAYLDTQQAGDIQLMSWRQAGMANSTAEDLYQEIQEFYKNDKQQIDKATAWLAQNIEDAEERQVFADFVKNPVSRPARTKYIPKEYLMYVAFSYSREGNTELTPGMNLKTIQLDDPDDEEELQRKVDELIKKVQFKFDAFENKIVELGDSYGLGSDPDLGSGFGQREIVWDHKTMTTSSSESNKNRQQILAKGILNFQAELKKYVASFNNTLIKIGLPGIGEYSTWSGVLGDQLTDQQVRYFATPEGFANLASGKIDVAKMLDDNVEKQGVTEHGGGMGRSVKKFRAQRGLDEKGTGPLDQKLQRLKVQARRQFPRAHTDDEALLLKLLDKETQDDQANRRTDARQDAELKQNFALDREQDDDIDNLQAQASVKEHGGGIGPRQRWQDLMPETVTDVKSGMAQIYRKLAPKIERYRDSFLAGQLYDELENYAELHGAEREFKQMMNGARNRAHMEYDTNPGGFHNWFWFLPFEDDTMTESNDDIKKRMSKLEALALAANRAGDDAKCKMYQQKIQSLKQKLSQSMNEGSKPGEYYIHTVYFKDGTKKRVRVTSDEFDVADYYTKRGQAVDRVDYDFQLHSDTTEGLKSTLAGAALAGAMALGGAGAAQAQSAAGGSSMPNATTIIQQIQSGKIQNQNDLSAALGDNQTNRRVVWAMLQAKAGLPGHGADSVINALGKKSPAGAQQPAKSAGQSGVIIQKPTDNFEGKIKEDQDSSGVERAILNRIMVAHTDLLMKFGPDKVMQAAEEVAYNVGDVDEIGTSDVSAYVAQVKQILGATA